MATDEKVIGFTESQVQDLVTSIFGSVNTRIVDRITQNITGGDTTHNPSADAVKIFTETYLREKIRDLFSVEGDLSADTIKNSITNILKNSEVISVSIEQQVNSIVTSKMSEFETTFNGKLSQKADTTTLNSINSTLTTNKMDKVSPTSFTATTANWKTDSDANFPNYYDISVSGITAKDVPSVVFDIASLDKCGEFSVSPVCESLNGIIRIRAKVKPTSNLTGTCTYQQAK